MALSFGLWNWTGWIVLRISLIPCGIRNGFRYNYFVCLAKELWESKFDQINSSCYFVACSQNPTAQRTELVALLPGLWHQKPHRSHGMHALEQEQHASTGGWRHTLSPTCSAILTIGLCWLTCQWWPLHVWISINANFSLFRCASLDCGPQEAC